MHSDFLQCLIVISESEPCANIQVQVNAGKGEHQVQQTSFLERAILWMSKL
jgi:hypothetical protein